MKTTKILTTLILSFGFIICLADISKAEPMSTAFTYQGHLYDNNDIADGQTLPLEEWEWTIVDGLPEVDQGVSPSVGLNSQGQVTVAFYNWVLNYAIFTDIPHLLPMQIDPTSSMLTIH